MKEIILPNKDYKGFIFDCDGTLADSMDAHYVSWCKSFEKHGAKFHFDRELFRDMGGITLIETVKILNQKYNDTLSPVEVVKDKEQFFLDNIHLTTPKHEVIEIAKKYKGKIPMCVASGNTRNSVLKTLSAIGIEGFFEHICTQEDVVNGKPAPDIFLLAAKKMNVNPKECLVFEDAIPGFNAAISAGMDLVKVD